MVKWDSNAPLELLKEMPAQLSKDNLQKIQLVIDKDKYICSSELQRDLCGEYAPFCEFCDKNITYPCAVAYVKMKQIDGMNIEIAAENAENEVQPEADSCETAAEEEVVEVQPKKRIRIAIAKKRVNN